MEVSPYLYWVNLRLMYAMGKRKLNYYALLVIDRDGPSLLGRNWLACFQLDWKAIHTIQHMTLNNLLSKYKSVFLPGLGTLKGLEAKIHVDPNVTAHFRKARSMPFSMRELVENRTRQLKITRDHRTSNLFCVGSANSASIKS